MNHEEFDSLSKRLKYLMDTAGIKQVHLASKLGVSPQAINHLCNSNTKTSKHTKKLAEILKANEQWLENGVGQPFTEPKLPAAVSTMSSELPVYFFDQIKKVVNFAQISQLNPVEHYWAKGSLHPDSFAFYSPDNIFAPKFEKGDIIVIDPQAKVINGAYALVYLTDKKELLFCQLYKMAGHNGIFGLHPELTNGLFEINSHDIIYGIYQECLKRPE